MRDIVVLETLEDIDKDKDGRVSLEEYIGKSSEMLGGLKNHTFSHVVSFFLSTSIKINQIGQMRVVSILPINLFLHCCVHSWRPRQ